MQRKIPQAQKGISRLEEKFIRISESLQARNGVTNNEQYENSCH
jgi:hypothetical protein